jgi:hypothetical protein
MGGNLMSLGAQIDEVLGRNDRASCSLGKGKSQV